MINRRQNKAIRRETTLETGTLEECLYEINDFVQALDHYRRSWLPLPCALT